MEFIADHLLVIIISILILLVGFYLMRKFIKILLIFVLVSFVLVTLFDVKPEKIFDFTKTTIELTKTSYEKTLKPIIDSELKDATYNVSSNRDYVIKTKSLSITGNLDENKATVVHKKKTYTIDVTPIEGLLAKMKQEVPEKTN